jgi:hypothetical protein
MDYIAAPDATSRPPIAAAKERDDAEATEFLGRGRGRIS